MSVQLKNFSEALNGPDASKIYEQKVRLTPEELAQVEQFVRDKWIAEGNTTEAQTIQKSYAANDFVFKRGDKADAIYFVVSGQVLCYIHKVEGYFLALDRTPSSGFFGEVATIGFRVVGGEKRERTASAIALTDIVLVKLPEPWLEEFIENYPALFRKISSGMVERLDRSAQDMNEARLLIDALEENKKEAAIARGVIHARWVDMLGSYWFLGFYVVGIALWFWVHTQYQWDKNIQWFPLTLSLVQIVIGTLVLKSQLHLAQIDAKSKAGEGSVILTSAETVNNMAHEMQQMQSALMQVLENTKLTKVVPATSPQPAPVQAVVTQVVTPIAPIPSAVSSTPYQPTAPPAVQTITNQSPNGTNGTT